VLALGEANSLESLLLNSFCYLLQKLQLEGQYYSQSHPMHSFKQF
jgi:hypothetical protein